MNVYVLDFDDRYLERIYIGWFPGNSRAKNRMMNEGRLFAVHSSIIGYAANKMAACMSFYAVFNSALQPPILYFDTIFQYLHCYCSFEVYISCKPALKTTTISSALKATSFKINSMRLSFFKFNYSLISCMS